STSRSRRRNRGKGSGGRRASRHKLTEQSRLTHEPGTQAVGGFGELRSISASRSVEDRWNRSKVDSAGHFRLPGSQSALKSQIEHPAGKTHKSAVVTAPSTAQRRLDACHRSAGRARKEFAYVPIGQCCTFGEAPHLTGKAPQAESPPCLILPPLRGMRSSLLHLRPQRAAQYRLARPRRPGHPRPPPAAAMPIATVADTTMVPGRRLVIGYTVPPSLVPSLRSPSPSRRPPPVRNPGCPSAGTTRVATHSPGRGRQFGRTRGRSRAFSGHEGLLLLTPVLVAPSLTPVTGQRQQFLVESAFPQQVTAQVPDHARLAVDERLHRALTEVEPPYLLDEVGTVDAIRPPDVRRRLRRQRLLFGRVLDEQSHRGGRVRGKGLQGRGDGGQSRFVPAQRVVIDVCTGCVRAAGPPEQHLVTRLCLRGPRTTEPLVTVHEDVQGELPRLGVVVPHGVGTHTRPLVTRQGRLHGIEIERFRIADARHGEQHFDVAVGETVVLERSQPLTPAHDPDHVRGEPFGAHHLSTEHGLTVPT